MDSLEEINSKTRRAYNLAAQRYHELFHDEMNEKEYDRKLLDAFASKFSKDSLICDAGCGPSGHIGRYLFEKGIPVIGVDIADQCIEWARHYNPEMRFERGDIGNLEFADETFDGVIAYYSIIDTPRRYVGRIFREFNRVLKPNGFLLVAVKAGTTEGYLTELLGLKIEIYFGLFTQKEIACYFEQSGFQPEFIEERTPYNFEMNVARIFAVGKKFRSSF
jgi:ubiquinone/menaquinone biosynthesis C-methylase UbiE